MSGRNRFGEGILLLLGETALAELIEETIDRIIRARFHRALGTTDEDGDAVDVELLEARAELFGRKRTKWQNWTPRFQIAATG